MSSTRGGLHGEEERSDGESKINIVAGEKKLPHVRQTQTSASVPKEEGTRPQIAPLSSILDLPLTLLSSSQKTRKTRSPEADEHSHRPP